MIDWKTRFKNPTYIIQLIASISLPVVLPILSYYNINFTDLTSWETVVALVKDVIMNPYIFGMVVLNVINSTVDPRTKGIGDNLTIKSEEFEYEDIEEDM